MQLSQKDLDYILDEHRKTRNKLDLSGKNLCELDLSGKDLSDACGLLPGSLSGTKLSNAKLPENIANFDELEHIAEISRNASTIFFILLGACLYSWLTISTTAHVALLDNSTNLPLPIINILIPTIGFYIVAPLIVLAAYIYFHFYLERLWIGLATLPAVFPDGKTLDEKAYPWLLNGLVRAHLKYLQNRRGLMSKLENGVTLILAWVLVPLTLLYFWFGYIPRHDCMVTSFHIILIVSASVFCIVSHWIAVRTLRSEASKTNYPDKWTIIFALILITTSTISSCVSWGVLNQDALNQQILNNSSDKSILSKYPYKFLWASTYLDIRGSDVSVKPANWTGKPENAIDEIKHVKGADLQNQNLRNMVAQGAFFARARLCNADLRGAKLALANFRQAVSCEPVMPMEVSSDDNHKSAGEPHTKLEGADIWRADLREADLRKANFEGAILVETNLSGADLVGAILERANLKGALLKPFPTGWEIRPVYLFGANLSGANLEGANLEGAYLDRAKLDPAKGVLGKPCPTDPDSADTRGDKPCQTSLKRAKLQEAKFEKADLSNAILEEANLRWANLSGANLEGANLQRANLRWAKLDPAKRVLGEPCPTDPDSADTRGDKPCQTSLKKADLSNAIFEEANLRWADLQGANLQGADLQGADLQGADLQGADLQGADLEKTRSLVQDQLNRACGNEATRLPPELRLRPCPAEKSDELEEPDVAPSEDPPSRG